MSLDSTLTLVYAGAIPNVPSTQLLRFLLPAGTIDSIRVKYEGGNGAGDVTFNFKVDGTDLFTTELLIASGADEAEATGVAETVTNDQWGTFSIDAIADGSLASVTSIGFHITYTPTTVQLTGAQTVAGVKTFSDAPLIPASAYDATTWNGSLKPATEDAVRDKIEDILDGVTFTGDVVVPDEAYDEAAWNGSLEVPTKNALRDKIETLGAGGSVATDTIFDAKGDLAVGTGADTAAKLTVGTDGHFLKANSAQATGLEWVALAGGGDMLAANNLSDLASAVTALTNLGLTATAAEINTLDGITATVAELNILDGVTATAAELNALDGITATVTELNYTDGVTSAIQTQLDAKAAKTGETHTNPKLDLDASAAADDTYSGVTISGRNNSGGVTQWDAVYINGSSAFVLADANGTGTYPAIGLAVATVATGNATTVITHGVVRNDAWAWTIGGVIYLSTTAGGLTQTAPSTSGDKVQVIGIAISADEMLVNPSSDYFTIT